MKNKVKFFGIIALGAIIVFMITACDHYPQGTPNSDFFGSWRCNGTPWRQYTISENRIAFLHEHGGDFAMGSLTWTAVNNDGPNASTFPNGYNITGTITSINKYGFFISER